MQPADQRPTTPQKASRKTRIPNKILKPSQKKPLFHQIIPHQPNNPNVHQAKQENLHPVSNHLPNKIPFLHFDLEKA